MNQNIVMLKKGYFLSEYPYASVVVIMLNTPESSLGVFLIF